MLKAMLGLVVLFWIREDRSQRIISNLSPSNLSPFCQRETRWLFFTVTDMSTIHLTEEEIENMIHSLHMIHSTLSSPRKENASGITCPFAVPWLSLH